MRDLMIREFVVGVSAMIGLLCFPAGSTYEELLGRLVTSGTLVYLSWSVKIFRDPRRFPCVVLAALIVVVTCRIYALLHILVPGKSDAWVIISSGSFTLAMLFASGWEHVPVFEAGMVTLFSIQLCLVNFKLLPIPVNFCFAALIIYTAEEEFGLIRSLIWEIVGGVSAINGLFCFAVGSTYNMSFAKLGIGGILFYLLISSTMLYLIWGVKRIRVPERFQVLVVGLIFVVTCFISVLLDKLVPGKSDAWSIVSYGLFALMSLSMSRRFELGFETGFFTFFLTLFVQQLCKTNLKLSPIALVFCLAVFILRHYTEFRELSRLLFVHDQGIRATGERRVMQI